MRKTRILPMIFGILLIVGGVISLFSPVETSTVIPYIIGLALSAAGVGKIFRWADEKRFYGRSRWSLAGAVICLAFGLILVFSPAFQLSMGASMIMLIGCWILVMGILRIVHAFRLKQMDGYDVWGSLVSSSWYMALFPGIGMVLFGLLNILRPQIGLGMIGALTGIVMIGTGTTLLSFGQAAWFW